MKSLEKLIRDELDSYNSSASYATGSTPIFNTKLLAEKIAKQVALNYKDDYVPRTSSW